MIALVQINSPDYRYTFPPFGLLFVGYALKKAGYDVKIFHCTPEEISNVAKHIVKKDPIFVGFSVIIGKQTKFSADMSKLIKSMSDVPIVWGGPYPTLSMEQCLSESYIDIVVLGEGEETAVDLAKALEKGKDLKNVKGIGYKKGNNIVVTKPRALINMDDYKMDWDLIDIKEYLRPNITWGCSRVLRYVTSRGCPYNCGFCYNLVFHKRRWRGRSKELIIPEIEQLKDEYNIDGLVILDDNFFVDIERAFAILKAIDLPCRGDPVVKNVTRQFVKRLVECNVRGMLIGLESGSNRILKLMNKNITVRDIIRCVRLISEAPQISPLYSFILGVPTETWDETQKTIDLILRVHDIDPRALFTVGCYLPFPGTPFYEMAIRDGFVPPKRTEDWAIVDRWNDKLNPSWLPWADETTAHKFVLIRSYANYLHIGTHLKFPLISWLSYQRLAHRNFSFSIDYYIMEWLFRNVNLKPEGILTKLIKRKSK